MTCTASHSQPPPSLRLTREIFFRIGPPGRSEGPNVQPGSTSGALTIPTPSSLPSTSCLTQVTGGEPQHRGVAFKQSPYSRGRTLICSTSLDGSGTACDLSSSHLGVRGDGLGWQWLAVRGVQLTPLQATVERREEESGARFLLRVPLTYFHCYRERLSSNVSYPTVRGQRFVYSLYILKGRGQPSVWDVLHPS